MNLQSSKKLWLNPRGLNHSGGVARWANSVAEPLQNKLDITRIKAPGLESPNHLVTRFAELLTLPSQMQEHDLLISLCNWGPVIENQFLVIHDIAPLIYPRNFSHSYSIFAKFMIPQLIRKARAIATVSDFSRNEICNYFDISKNIVHVLGAASGLKKNEAKNHVYLKKKPNFEYMIFIGGHDPRKNLDFLISIWPKIYVQRKLKLLVINSGRLITFIENKLPHVEWIIEKYQPTDAELIFLIENAVALLSPSVYEGYGMPVIEGLSLGTPVVSSPTGIAIEIDCKGLTVLQLEPNLWFEKILQLEKSHFTYEHESWENVANRITTVIGGVT